MTTIGLIRHGSTAWNKEGRAQGHTDNPLDAEGCSRRFFLLNGSALNNGTIYIRVICLERDKQQR